MTKHSFRSIDGRYTVSKLCQQEGASARPAAKISHITKLLAERRSENALPLIAMTDMRCRTIEAIRSSRPVIRHRLGCVWSGAHTIPLVRLVFDFGLAALVISQV
jgi:hypothetical protein